VVCRLVWLHMLDSAHNLNQVKELLTIVYSPVASTSSVVATQLPQQLPPLPEREWKVQVGTHSCCNAPHMVLIETHTSAIR
jgi:hypothetical protein